jgi:glycosyltransferase involved in cell wall biosynthesis
VFYGLSRPAPVDPAASASFRSEVGADDQTVLVALVGRINRWKGQQLLVDAAERLEKEGAGLPRMVYVFAGSPPNGQEQFRRDLEARIARSPLRDRLRLTGFRDPWPIYDASDVVAVPSTEPEPFGLVALEAMLAGVPVIASAHGGLVEFVDDGVNGMLFAPNDVGALAGAIAKLAGDGSLRERLGTRGRELGLERFAPPRYVAEMTRAMEQAISR